VAHPDRFLLKIASLLKKGGYVVMTTPNGGYFRNKLPKFSNCANPNVVQKLQFKPDADRHVLILYRDEIGVLAQAAGIILELDTLNYPRCFVSRRCAW